MDSARLTEKCAEHQLEGVSVSEIPARLRVGVVIDGTPLYKLLPPDVTEAEADEALLELGRLARGTP
jgi:hypothetical protein